MSIEDQERERGNEDQEKQASQEDLDLLQA